jgi:hypothetical protein
MWISRSRFENLTARLYRHVVQMRSTLGYFHSARKTSYPGIRALIVVPLDGSQIGVAGIQSMPRSNQDV